MGSFLSERGPACTVHGRLVSHEIFNAVISERTPQRSFLRRDSPHGPAENERILNGLPGAKDPKETGGSNPLRSSNEALRTVSADRWQDRIE